MPVWKRLAVFGLLGKLTGGIVLIAGDFAVPADFLYQIIGVVVAQTIVFAVFIGEGGETTGFIVLVAEAVAQRIDAFQR